MRWLASVGVVVVLAAVSSTASARRVRFSDPCEGAATWKRVESCLGKRGTLSMVYQSDGVKVVRLAHRPPAIGAQLILYTQRDENWQRGGLSTFTNSSTELIGVTPHTTPYGAGIRVDIGTTISTTISTGASSSRGILRRVFTSVCWPGAWTCRSVMTSCEAYVRGRVFWAFRGELVWHATLGLRLRGSSLLAGGGCTPVKSMLLEETQ